MNGQMEQEKQIIEEMAIAIANYDDSIICELGDCKGCSYNNFGRKCIWLSQAEALYNADHRKVVMCKDCKYFFNEHIKACTYWNGHATTETNYCSCAKMKGAE